VQWSTDDDPPGCSRKLTHWFDAALHPGLPAWVMGRATYVVVTGDGGSKALDERLIDSELQEAFRLVFGSPGARRPRGRDRVPAQLRRGLPCGRSLPVDRRGPAARQVRPYRARLPALLEAPRVGAAAPDQVFLSTMRRSGRTRVALWTLEAAVRVSRILTPETPEWARRASAWARSETPGSYPLADRSNHPTSRHRLDPPAEGEALAALAAVFLEGCGRASDALEAHAVADKVDEADVVRWERALALEVATGRKDAAFARRRMLARQEAEHAEPGKPELSVLAGVHGAATTYLDAVAKAAGDALGAGRPRAARVLRGEHDRLASLVGRAELREAACRRSPAGRAAHGH
jgi:hypothetical protein